MRPVLAAIAAALASGAATSPARAAACFPEEATVRIDHRLWALAPELDENYRYVGGKGTWGTCTADRGIVRDRDGSLVALLGCGLVVRGAGIANEYGITVGMRGERVLEAYGDGPSSKLMCTSSYEPGQRRTYCWIPHEHVDQRRGATWGYTVWGRPPKSALDEDGLLRGEKALAFFRARTIVLMTDRGTCH